MTLHRPHIGVTFADQGGEEITTEMGSRGRHAIQAMAIVLLVLLCYLPALRGGFVLSDEQNILASYALRGMEGLRAIWSNPFQMPVFGPLAQTILLAETKVFRVTRPAGFHAFGILIHAINSVLLWTLLRRLVMPAPFIAAAAFAVHPLNVETVAWIGQQRMLLCALFYFATILVYLRVTGIDPAPPEDLVGPRLPRRRAVLLSLTMLLFVSAVLCHPAGVTIPAALLVLVWWKRGAIGRSDLAPIVPMIAVSLILLALLVALRHGGAVPAGISARVMIAGRAVWTYAFSVVFPVGLSFAYPKWQVGGAAQWQWLFLAATVGVFALAWMFRGRLGRGAMASMILFVVGLLPGLVGHDAEEYAFIADHASYLASAVLISSLLAVLEIRIRRFSNHPAAIPLAGSIIIISLCALTIARAGVYRSDETIWRHALKQNARSITALNQVGLIELRRNKNANAAIDLFTRALVFDGNDTRAQLNIADAYALQGDVDKAKMQYYQVLASHPDNADARVGLGLTLNTQGFSNEALAEFERALQLRPNDARTQLYIGRIHEFHSRNEEAERWYRKAIASDPRQTDAYVQLALLRFYKFGDQPEAERLMLIARQISPRGIEVLINTGVMQFELAKVTPRPEDKKRMFEEAAMFFGQAALIDPTSSLAFRHRGTALAARAQYTDARQERISYMNQAIEAFDRATELGDAEAGGFAADARRQRDALESGGR